MRYITVFNLYNKTCDHLVSNGLIYTLHNMYNLTKEEGIILYDGNFPAPGIALKYKIIRKK